MEKLHRSDFIARPQTPEELFSGVVIRHEGPGAFGVFHRYDIFDTRLCLVSPGDAKKNQVPVFEQRLIVSKGEFLTYSEAEKIARRNM